MHILVVDPNETLGMLLLEELKRMGHTGEQCATGEVAIQVAHQQTPEIVFLDMGLQTPDTATLAKELRTINAQLRLVLMPFMGEQPVMDAEVPIQGVLPKPFFPPELPACIESVLQAPMEGLQLTSAAPSEGVSTAEPELELVFEPEVEFEPAEEPKPVQTPMPASVSPPPVVLQPEPVTSKPPEPRSAPAAEGADASGFSYEVFAQNRVRAERLMNGLAQELAADAVLLTYGGGLLTWVGALGQAEAESISRAVVHGWRTSAEVARILGREQVRFEQSIAGDDYMLYALSVDVNAIMAVAIRGSAPLGLLRHRARSVAEQIAEMCSV
ncbi:MAG: hypothetical protein JXA21_26860 [Anaerolineae bacterium]|nr:hypothetical protein [Anaerolineae bacterium]